MQQGNTHSMLNKHTNCHTLEMKHIGTKLPGIKTFRILFQWFTSLKFYYKLLTKI